MSSDHAVMLLTAQEVERQTSRVGSYPREDSAAVKHQLRISSEATTQAETSTIAIGGWAHLSRMTCQSCDL